MYCANLGLERRPFEITPDTDFFFADGDRGALLDGLVYAVETGAGLVEVVGEVGSGKTLLSRMLAERLARDFDVAFLVNPDAAGDDILSAVASELGLSLDAESGRVERLNAFHRHLLRRFESGRRVVVLIDEAQGLPLKALETLRLIGNLETGTRKLLQIVLFGQPELDRQLDHPEVRQIRDRVVHRFWVRPLKRHEVAAYLRHRLWQAGYRGPELFGRAAIRLFAWASGGLMRRLNLLADKALLAAHASGSGRVGLAHALAALGDLRVWRHGRWGRASLVLGSLLSFSLLGGIYLFALSPLPGEAVARAVSPVAPPVVVEADGGPERVGQEVADEADASVTGNEGRRDRLSERLAATERRLEHSGRRSFSIQLMQLPPEAMDRFARLLERAPWREHVSDLYLYRLRGGGKAEGDLLVLYGDFDSLTAAREAMEALPAAFRRWGAYVRNFPRRPMRSGPEAARLAMRITTGEGHGKVD